MAACARAPDATGTLVLQDDTGAEVRLSRPATRIASLVPATTEWLFALGAGRAVVGRTTWCDYPAAAAEIPSLGDGINPNIEAILAVRPDLVLLYQSAGNHPAAARLRGLGIPVLLLRTDRLEDMDRHLALLGRATGLPSAADSLRAAITAGLAAARAAPDPAAPSLFILAWDQPPMTLGAGSFLSEIVELAGARNLFADIRGSSATISIEAVVARDPDFVLLTALDSVPAFAGRPEWGAVAAVRERRFVRVHGSEFNRPGPRTPAAIAALRRALAEVAR